MKIELRKSKKSELSIISRIYVEEFSKYPYNESWSSKKARDKFNFYYKYYDIYTIFYEKEIVGLIVLNPNFMCPREVVYGEEMAISSNFQNKGIGTQVVKEILEIYKNKGFKRFLGIVNKKGNSIKMFKKLNVKPSKIDILIEKEFK